MGVSTCNQPLWLPITYDYLLPAELPAYEALHSARAKMANEKGVKHHWIIHNSAICEMVRRVPTTDEELAAVPGVRQEGSTWNHACVFQEVLRPFIAELQAVHAAMPGLGIASEAQLAAFEALVEARTAVARLL